MNETVNVLRDQVAQLTRELERSREAHGLIIIRCTKAEQALSGEKTLHECTAADAKRIIDELESEVTRLTVERDEWRALATKAQDQRDQWMSKAGELTEEVAGLRESIERADAAALSTIREVTKERDAANALLERWCRAFSSGSVADTYLRGDSKAYLSGTSDTNPRI